jgi:peptidoglycan/xylan/chitin deacetylase (PgdA/CDA1 family)
MINTKAAIREFLFRAVLMTGLEAAVRRFVWRDRVAVLLYHDPSPETLDAHLQYLKSVCDIVSLSQVNTAGSGRPRAAITFDDGHAGNADLLPVFIKHKVRPTIYLCSSIVTQSRVHWWLHPNVTQADIDRLKNASNTERLSELSRLGYRQEAAMNAEEASGLTAQQIAAMLPYVDFQSHTRFHPVLPRCTDAECMDEVEGSKREVEQLTGTPCHHFAYPNGNYGPREIAVLGSAGYMTARTCDVGWNDAKTYPYRLRAIELGDDSSTLSFAVQLTGLPMFIRNLRNGGTWGGHRAQH